MVLGPTGSPGRCRQTSCPVLSAVTEALRRSEGWGEMGGDDGLATARVDRNHLEKADTNFMED